MKQRWTTFFAAVVMVAATAVVGAAQQESIDELRAKAEAGDTDAQNDLGLAYANGEGVRQDDAVAVRWYRKAAGQGYGKGYGSDRAKAEHNLKVMYADGRAVP
jgi:hypothetical protein